MPAGKEFDLARSKLDLHRNLNLDPFEEMVFRNHIQISIHFPDVLEQVLRNIKRSTRQRGTPWCESLAFGPEVSCRSSSTGWKPRFISITRWRKSGGGYMDVSKNSGTLKWMGYNGKPYWTLLKWMIWGYHYFWGTPIWGPLESSPTPNKSTRTLRQSYKLTNLKFNSSPLKSYRAPRGMESSNHDFLGVYVKIRGCSVMSFFPIW